MATQLMRRSHSSISETARPREKAFYCRRTTTRSCLWCSILQVHELFRTAGVLRGTLTTLRLSRQIYSCRLLHYGMLVVKIILSNEAKRYFKKSRWRNPDALLVFSAGNTGCLSQCEGTVGSPAVLKNGLTVGASLNDHQSWQYYIDPSIG